MRNDMDEVIFERPRRKRGPDYKNTRRSQKNEFNQLTKVSMRKPYGWDRHRQDELTGPIRRFLKSKVGSPWNDVWSEVCAVADSRSVVGFRLRESVLNYVHFNVIEHEDGMFTYEGRYRLYPMRNTFYVNQDGILKYVSSHRHKWKPESKIVYYHGLAFYKHEGVWYEIETQPIPKRRPDLPDWKVTYKGWYDSDQFGNHLYSYSWRDQNTCFYAYGENVFVISKKQIGKRMIKKIEKYIGEKNG